MNPPSPSCVAFIPARSGSKRVPSKNTRLLQGHPLLAHTIAAARASGVFADVVVSTDSSRVAEIAEHYGAKAPFLRPAEISGDLAPDITWVEHALDQLSASGFSPDAFSILRPTSPFRKPETIVRAWKQFLSQPEADSLRAVEKCKQHPGKMWVLSGDFMEPLLKDGPQDVPWHSTAYQALPPVYAQNASLEIAWTRVVREGKTISGRKIIPFFTQGFEGFDINEAKDFWYAEQLIQNGEAELPVVSASPFPLTTSLSQGGVS